MSCDLYRFYNAASELLYVGISLSAIQRAHQHRAEKNWWGDVARMEVEHLANREAAIDRERRAIIAERPIHNVVHNGRNARRNQPWACQRCGSVIPEGKEQGYIQVDREWDYWECVCRGCDDRPNASYWIDTAAIANEESLARMTDHLRCKNWFYYDAWVAMVYQSCRIPRAALAVSRHTSRRATA